MKKKLVFLLLFISCFCLKMQAQIVLCGSVPLSYNHDSIDFTAAPVSFGDSMITFQITNDHLTQGFAYPLAKLVPLIPLPPGMSLTPGSSGWTVFASSWNPGVTMPFSIFYNVPVTIPVNYSVTFQLWVSNLLPLLIDSCYFDSTFTINLNPSSLSVKSFHNNLTYSIYPDPVLNYLGIKWNSSLELPIKISLFNVSGGKIMEEGAMKGTTQMILDVRSLPSGIYFLSLEEKDGTRVMKKLIVANE